MDCGNCSHRRLQDEAKPHRPIRSLDQVVPESLEGFDRNAMPQQADDDQDDGEHDDEPGEEAQLLRIGIAHRAAPAVTQGDRATIYTSRAVVNRSTTVNLWPAMKGVYAE